MISKLFSYIQESRLEFKRVNWPTRQATIKMTIMVIVLALIVAAFLGAFDILFHYLLSKFLFKN